MISNNIYTMYASVFFVFFVVALTAANDQEAKLRFYYGSFDNHTEFSITDAQKIMSTPWYNPSQSTVIFCHGFTGVPNGPAVTAIIKAYIETGESNVALLNWDYLASPVTSNLANSYVNWAAPNARQLAVRLVDTFLNLSDAGLDLNKIHLIGHSLGAHIWGITGNSIRQKGVTLPRITGLDPAAFGFEKKPANQRLNSNSAAFVDVVHTDSSKYGMKSSIGVVDFWPNFRIIGPARQPGCSDRPSPFFSADDLCSHHRSWRLWVDAMKYPGTLIGSYAKNYKTWKNYSGLQRNATTLKLGEYNLNARPGNYYFVTNSDSPYGLSSAGL